MQQIAVVGAGTMGNGSAHTFAQHGYTVALIDVRAAAIEKALASIEKNLDRQLKKGVLDETKKTETLNRISTYTDVKSGVSDADLVVEAVAEDAAVKLQLFKELDRWCKPGAVLASNTSSISITRIAAATNRPGQVIGMHFMNPVPVMKLVEVIRGYATDGQTAVRIMDLARSLNKTPVDVQDYPGFVSNRILMPMINEAIYTLFEGVASAEAIDEVMQLGMAHPMGPLKLADFIGLDVCLSILNVLYEGFGNPKYAPCPLLVNMVRAGKLGIKTGKGFYSYETS